MLMSQACFSFSFLQFFGSWSSYQNSNSHSNFVTSGANFMFVGILNLWWIKRVCCFISLLDVTHVSVGFGHVQTHILFVTKKLSTVGALEIGVVPMLLVAVVAQVSRRVEPLVALKTEVYLVNHACMIIKLVVPLKRFTTLHAAPRQQTTLIHCTVVHSLWHNLGAGPHRPQTSAPRRRSLPVILPRLVWGLPDIISVVHSSNGNIACACLATNSYGWKRGSHLWSIRVEHGITLQPQILRERCRSTEVKGTRPNHVLVLKPWVQDGVVY